MSYYRLEHTSERIFLCIKVDEHSAAYRIHGLNDPGCHTIKVGEFRRGTTVSW